MKTRQIVKGNFEIGFYDEEPFDNKSDAMTSINHVLNTGLIGIASLKLDNVSLETESEKCSKCFFRGVCADDNTAFKNCVHKPTVNGDEPCEFSGVSISSEDRGLYNKLTQAQKKAVRIITENFKGDKEKELSSAISFFSDYEKQINSCFFNYSLPSFDFIKNGLSVAALINNYYIDKVKKETLEKQTAQKECQNVKPDTEEELTYIDHVTVSPTGIMIGELGDEYEDLSEEQKDMIVDKTALFMDKMIGDCVKNSGGK